MGRLVRKVLGVGLVLGVASVAGHPVAWSTPVGGDPLGRAGPYSTVSAHRRPVAALEGAWGSVARDSTIASAQRGPVDPVELEAFLDDLLGQQMADSHIAGAAVAVVKDGDVLLSKGYGYADVKRRVPVDPEQTLFRTGSVGKVLTWTAVMQLVEQGKLDLDADINDYLDFAIPDTYPERVTLKHLMTHTSGFEDRHFGSAVTDPEDVVPTREWLVSHVWARVRPPGLVGYSNYNAILAGYIVARTSGQEYGDYMQAHVFDPLGMAHTSARSPLPPPLRPRLSVGYTYDEGTFRPFPDYIGHPSGMPSGGHATTVSDMARFMIARLEGGRYRDPQLGEARILEERTAQLMLTTLYTPDPRLRGVAYGLFDWSGNGRQTLGHTGYYPPMHSLMLLLPSEHLGVFVSYNTRGGGEANGQHSGFHQAFVDHYYPAPAATPLRPPADFATRAGKFVGTYNAYCDYTTLLKVIGLFGGGYTAVVSDPGDGTLALRLEGREMRLVEVEPLFFRQADGPFGAVFRADGEGRITHLYADTMPQYALRKLAWYETGGLNMVLLQGYVLLFASVLPVGAIRAMRTRRSGSDQPRRIRGQRAAQWVLFGISASNLLVLSVLVWGAMGGMTNELLELPPGIQALLGLGVLSALLTIVAVAFTARAWSQRAWGVPYRIYYTLVAACAVGFVWFLHYWNMLGWRF
jgi:CubicO group peptidase (beta-lactamase class C family)